jgi:hypothetical protein
MKYRSSVNSVGDSETGSPAFQTSWVSSSSSMSANFSRELRGSSAPQPRDDLLEAERLRDVVVAAERETRDLVLQGVAGGQEQRGRVDPVGTQPSQHAEPVHAGHHHVEDHRVGPDLAGLVEGGRAAGGRVHLEALELEADGEKLDDVGLVVHDEDLRFGGVLR